MHPSTRGHDGAPNGALNVGLNRNTVAEENPQEQPANVHQNVGPEGVHLLQVHLPLPNPAVPINGIPPPPHERTKEESSYYPPTRNHQPTRKRGRPEETTSRRPNMNHLNTEDNSPLAANLLNSSLPRFEVSSLEHYDGSGDMDVHLHNY